MCSLAASQWHDLRVRQRQAGGAKRGTRFRLPNYDPATEESYRPGSNFEPRQAVKLIAMCEALDISVAGFLNDLVDLVEVDPSTGKPVGWPKSVRLKSPRQEAG